MTTEQQIATANAKALIKVIDEAESLVSRLRVDQREGEAVSDADIKSAMADVVRLRADYVHVAGRAAKYGIKSPRLTARSV